MLQMLGIRKVVPPDGPDQIITEVTICQEDLRFVSGANFTPLNKLSQIVVTPNVLVLFSDSLKGQLIMKLQQQGATVESLKCDESKDQVFQNLI